jgi:hypothetical protein
MPYYELRPGLAVLNREATSSLPLASRPAGRLRISLGFGVAVAVMRQSSYSARHHLS